MYFFRLVADRDKSPDVILFISEKLSGLMTEGRCNISNAGRLLKIAQFCVTHCNDGKYIYYTFIVRL